MESTPEIQRAPLTEFYLDAKNPRLGCRQANADLSQEEILEMMNNWVLDELAESYIENGFWEYEALLAVEEELEGKRCLVVIDGNRRLAALIYLHRAINGEHVSEEWSSLVENRDIAAELFNAIPYLQINSRQEVESFLGFHHQATSIKKWFVEQKAEYIASLIDQQDMSYKEVARTIGTSISNVQYCYISHQLFLQMENCLKDFSVKKAKWRFTTMFFSLQTLGVQKYLGLDPFADPSDARIPIPENRLEVLENFARWLFGNQQHPSLLIGPQSPADFGRLLENPQAVQYLENNKRARFDVAWQLAYGDEEIIQLIDEARNNIAISLMHVHHYEDSPAIQSAAERLAINTKELLNQFPTICPEFLEDD